MTTGANPDQLIQAALDCFAIYGIRKTSLNDVAVRAGVSRATAYRVFGSKRQLFDAVVKADTQRFAAEVIAVHEALPEDASTEEHIATAIDFALTWVRQNPVIQRVLAEEPEEFLSAIIERPGRPTLVSMVTDLMSTWLESAPLGEGLAVTHRQAAEFVTRLVISLVLVPTTTLGDGRSIARIICAGDTHQTLHT